MPRLHLTDLSLRALKPGMYWDTTVPSFGIRVQKHRRTVLVMMGVERKRVSLGHWPHTQLADARSSARSLLYADEQLVTASSLSMQAAVDKYLKGRGSPSAVAKDATRPRSRSDPRPTVRPLPRLPCLLSTA